MKITSRFSIAVHTLLLLVAFKDKETITSNFIASSVNTNPVVIRRILLRLKAAEMVEVLPGRGGTHLLKSPEEITLFDIYRAVDCVDGDLFNFHDAPNPSCPVGKNIHFVLDEHLKDAQRAMENELKSVRLSDLTDKLYSNLDENVQVN